MLTFSIDNNIHIREITTNDSQELLDILLKNKTYLSNTLDWVNNISTIQDVNRFIHDAIRDTESLRGITFLIIFNNKIIGSVKLYDWHHYAKKISIGYWIAEEYSGRNIITNTCKRLLDYIFIDLQLNKVEAHYIPNNIASEKILTKLGFQKEGYIRASTYINGSIVDQWHVGLLYNDFKTLSK